MRKIVVSPGNHPPRKINVHVEHMVPLSHYVRIRPPGRNGKPMHIATGHRHARIGVRGIRLATVDYGGVICTSTEAIQEFVDLLSAGPSVPAVSPVTTTLGEAEAIAEANRLFG